MTTPDIREVFIVPTMTYSERGVESIKARVPERRGYFGFYSPDRTKALIVARGGTASYLHKRNYAEYIGTLDYADYRDAHGARSWDSVMELVRKDESREES